jgi:hypothetical protein
MKTMRTTTKTKNANFLLFTFTFLLFSLNGFAQSPIVSPSGQVGWWSGDGNANDIAGTNNGTLQDNASFAVGKIGQAFNFDGTDDRIEIPNIAALSPATISLEAWVKPTAINIGSRVISKDVSSVSCVSPFIVYSLETRGEFGGRATFFYTTADDVLHVLQGTTSIPLNVFSHISATFDGTTAKIYVNGVLENSQAVSGTLRSSTTPTIIGNADTACRGIGGNSAGFNGIIDEPSIYNRAITPDEITSIFNAGIAGKLKQNATINSSSLVSLWQGEGNGNDTRGINSGSLLDGTTFAAGKLGQAFQFVPNQRVLAPDSASLDLTNAVTIETWISPQQFGGAGNNSSVVIKGSIGGASGESYSLMFFANGSAALRLSNGSTIEQLFSAVILPLNTFSHIVGTYDGTTMRFYVNGVLTNSAVSSLGTLNNSAGPMLIGSNGIGPYDGKLDEVAIYSRALSQTEIRANYEAGNALSTVVGDASITFPTVSTAGITQQIPLDLSTLPSLPLGSTTAGLTYDIATTAVFTGSPQVCFNLPSVTNSTIFNNLRIVHLESNVWTNRTGTIDFATRIICTSGLTSLSPFVIVNGFGPTAAESSISGRVTTASGRGIRNVVIQINGGSLTETRYARTNPFGYYRFTELDAGSTYVLNVSSKRYSFANPTRVITLNEDLTDEDFVSDNK